MRRSQSRDALSADAAGASSTQEGSTWRTHREAVPPLYAWEEKKSKTSWGAQTVDYEKIAAAAVQAMKAADLSRFFVVCALVSDLYCPGHNPKQSPAKDSNLARGAVRYKVAYSKIAVTVRAELSKPKHNRNTKPDRTRRNQARRHVRILQSRLTTFRSKDKSQRTRGIVFHAASF